MPSRHIVLQVYLHVDSEFYYLCRFPTNWSDDRAIEPGRLVAGGLSSPALLQGKLKPSKRQL